MDHTLAKKIPISYLPPWARKKIEDMLDPEDGCLRDYRQLGQLLNKFSLLEVRALRANNNHVSITGVILDAAEKMGKSLGDLYDTLKQMNVAVLDDFERAWEEIIQRYRGLVHQNGEEGYDSRSSNCLCGTCIYHNDPVLQHSSYPCMSGENGYVLNGNSVRNPLNNLDHNAHCGSFNPYVHCSAATDGPELNENNPGDFSKLNTIVEPGNISWIPPSTVSQSKGESCLPDSHFRKLPDMNEISQTSKKQNYVSENQDQFIRGDNDGTVYRQGHEPKATYHQIPADECRCQYSNQQKQSSFCLPQQEAICCPCCKRNTAPSCYSIKLLVPRNAHSCYVSHYCADEASSSDVHSKSSQVTEDSCLTQDFVGGDPGYDIRDQYTSVTENPQFTPNCPGEACNSDDEEKATPLNQNPRVSRSIINAKLRFVFLTYGQNQNGENVDKQCKKLINRLEKYEINVVADRNCGLHCSKGLINGSVTKMERESNFELLQFFFNKATCVVIAITPGYCKYVTAAVEGNAEDCEAEASDHRKRARHVYTLMLNEYTENDSINKRFFPVKIKSEEICTEDKHIPKWMQSTLIYTYPGDRQKKLIEHLRLELGNQLVK